MANLTLCSDMPVLRGRKIGIIASEMKLPALQSKFRILNFKSALRHYIIIIYVPALTARYEGLVRADRAGRLVVRLMFSNKDLDDRQADSLRCYLRVSCFNWLIVWINWSKRTQRATINGSHINTTAAYCCVAQPAHAISVRLIEKTKEGNCGSAVSLSILLSVMEYFGLFLHVTCTSNDIIPHHCSAGKATRACGHAPLDRTSVYI